MRANDWATARHHYQAVLARRADNVAIWVQYAHAAKELGDIADAERGYSRARALAPDDLDIQFHHARALILLDKRPEAMASLADILRSAPDHREAYAAIVQYGGRDHLPDGFQRHALNAADHRVTDGLDRTHEALDAWADAGTYPLRAYDAFRRDFPLRAPPAHHNDALFTIIVDARSTSPYFLRATLLSLIDQTYAGWRAQVLAPPDLADHPVASLGAQDEAISFITSFEPAADLVIHLTAGTILDPTALDWFAFTVQRTQCLAAWCDEDRAAEPWQGRRIHSDPLLWGVFDADLIAQTRTPPAAILLRNGGPTLSLTDDPAEVRRDALLAADRLGNVAHIPRVLASILRVPPRSEIAPPEGQVIRRWASDPGGAPPLPGPVRSLPNRRVVARGARPAVCSPPLPSHGTPIDVIIPTRDAPDLLAKAVKSLRAHATHPDRLRLTIVDNRSEQSETAQLLDQLSRSGVARVVTLDEAFNWSRANNVAAADSSADILVFANNDIEMLSQGWDDLLEAWLDSAGIGAVGARLLYPDGTLQHGGMVFGTGENSPRHEAVHAQPDETGPIERYDLVHRTSAVTGAFLGVKRTSFDQVGGFDAVRFAIGYNDIDFCLKLRAIGLDILYLPTIELIHHESKTRGLNVGRAKVAWDQGELRSLYQRWGEAMIHDPAYNPYWSRDRLYDGFREPALSELLRHIDLSALPNPWRIDQA